jgi:penicillin-binding protein 1A
MAKPKRKSDILRQRVSGKKRHFFRKFFLWCFLLGFIVVMLGSLASVAVYFYLSQNLPRISSLTDYHPPIITTVYSDDGRKIAEFFEERRIITPLDEMPQYYPGVFKKSGSRYDCPGRQYHHPAGDQIFFAVA